MAWPFSAVICVVGALAAVRGCDPCRIGISPSRRVASVGNTAPVLCFTGVLKSALLIVFRTAIAASHSQAVPHRMHTCLTHAGDAVHSLRDRKPCCDHERGVWYACPWHRLCVLLQAVGPGRRYLQTRNPSQATGWQEPGFDDKYSANVTATDVRAESSFDEE